MNKHTQPNTLWCFRRWSRKPWAAFAGMCRFKIGVLSVAMSIILLATHVAGAQTVGTDPLSQYRTRYLDSVQVTAPLSAAATHTVASQSRSLVHRKGIAPVQTAESVLRLLPSVDVRERSGKSPQADIAIRGGSFDQTMVMLNGIDFSDARTGHQSHSLPVDLDVLSDIAVVDAAAHPGALSGAVDFRTAPAFPRYLKVRLEGGAWGYGYGNLSGAWSGDGFRPGDRLTVLGAASYKRSDGYRHNTDFWNVNAYTRVLYSSPRVGSFDIQGGFQRREWGSNGFYSLRYPDQFESTLTGLASVRWTKSWRRLTLEATGSFRRNNDLFEMVRDNPDPGNGGIPFNYHTTYNVAGSLTASYDWRRAGTTSLGVDHTRHLMFSTAMGEALDDPSHRIPYRGANHPENYPKGVVRDITSAWAGHRKSWNGGMWLGGMATLVRTPYGTDGTFGAEAGWRPGKLFSLSGVALRSIRLPTFTDLFYNVATYHPDPNLGPETATTYRLTAEVGGSGQESAGNGASAEIGNGVSAEHDGFRGTASLWYRRTRDVIDWEQHEDGDWYSTQLNRLGTVGAELSVQYTSRGWLRMAMLNYGYIHSDMTVRTGYISKYALDYMRHKASAVVGVGFLRDFTLTLTGSFYDRVGSYITADGALAGYKPYFLLDGRLSWEPGSGRGSVEGSGSGNHSGSGIQLYLDATNITATRYFDFGGLPMPGAWISAGIVVTIR